MAHHAARLVTEDQHRLERGMVAEEVCGELGVDLRDLLEVAGLGVQGELGDVHG